MSTLKAAQTFCDLRDPQWQEEVARRWSTALGCSEQVLQALVGAVDLICRFWCELRPQMWPCKLDRRQMGRSKHVNKGAFSHLTGPREGPQGPQDLLKV